MRRDPVTPRTRKLSRRAKRARLEACVEVYRARYRLFDWAITVHYYATEEAIPDGEDRSAAGCTASSEYKQATIYFALDSLDDGELESTVAHELMHIILWPMTHHMDRWAGADEERREVARYSLEEVTTHLDRVMTGAATWTPRPIDEASPAPADCPRLP